MSHLAEDAVLADMARPDEVYRAGLAVGELRYQRCETCDGAVFYPRVVCPFCGGTALVTLVSAGRGTVYSSTAIRQRDADSYTVTMVDLDEGFRMLSTVQGIPAEKVEVGLVVMVAFDKDANGEPRAIFVPETLA